jgi:hypothetical protein
MKRIPRYRRVVAGQTHTRKIGRLLEFSLVVFLLVGCTSGSTAERRSSPTSKVSVSATSARLPTPTSYKEVCALEAAVCSCPNGSTDPICSQSVPASMLRPFHFPPVASGQACPTNSVNRDPVRPGIGQGALSRWPDGWFGAKTLWVVAPSYSGAVLVRGAQLDGNGPVGFGEAPLIGQLVIPPGPTVNLLPDGSRTAPGGIFIKGPGCYALQVDGQSFSYVIVVEVQLNLTTGDAR